MYYYTNPGSNSKLNNSDAFITAVKYNEVKYFPPDLSLEIDRRASTEIMKQLQRDFEDVLNGIVCFDRIFLCR